MQEVAADEAKMSLAELLDAVLRGERVVIIRDDQRAVQLMPVPTHRARSSLTGTARGPPVMSADFDAPLIDLDEHTR